MILNADLMNCKFSLSFSKEEINGIMNNNKFVNISFIGLLETLKNNSETVLKRALSEAENYFISHMASRIRVDDNNEMYVEYIVVDK